MRKLPAVPTVMRNALSPLGFDTSTWVNGALPSKFVVTRPRPLKVTVVEPLGTTTTLALREPS